MNALQLGMAQRDLIFAPNNAVAMTIKNGGNIGIGTITPSSLLSVGSGSSFQSTRQAQLLRYRD